MDPSAKTPQPTPVRPRSSDAESEDQGPREGPELIAAAAEGKPLSGEENDAALDWFLSDDPDEGELTRKLELNVGSSSDEKMIPWEIRAIDLDTLRRIRRSLSGTRAQRRAGAEGIDEVQANLRIVVEGTVAPDLKQAAKLKGIADPASALRIAFRRKPGLIGSIAGEIMSLSGYDEEDVREVSAAKN